MRVESINDEPNALSLGLIPIDQRLHALHKVWFGAPRGHFPMAPARMGREEQK
jgi:hypothetical protein